MGEELMALQCVEELSDVLACCFGRCTKQTADLVDELFFGGAGGKEAKNRCAGRIEPKHFPMGQIENDSAVLIHYRSKVAGKLHQGWATSFLVAGCWKQRATCVLPRPLKRELIRDCSPSRGSDRQIRFR